MRYFSDSIFQSIIYYTVRSPRLEQWLENPSIHEALISLSEDSYCDVDPTFSTHVDDDFDQHNSGISRRSFCSKYLDWIQYCASRREKVIYLPEVFGELCLRKRLEPRGIVKEEYLVIILG